MKVLYISHSHEGTGFSYAAHSYVKSLLEVGIDVVCRHIKLNENNPPVPSFIEECERKKVEGCTHVIQHLLPHHMSYIGGVKNIGLVVNDTSSLRYSGWDRYINCMDEVWIPNFDIYDEITIPTYYVPHAFDVEKYKKEYKPLDIKELGGCYNFYTIADLNVRKNLKDTLVAFHTEFHSNEPVNLVIKTSKYGMSPQQCVEAISSDINTIKTNLKLYPEIGDYKKEIIIAHPLNEDDIGSIHSECDCYISTSHGEAFNMPLFDSLAFGNLAISYTAPPYLNKFSGRLFLLLSDNEPCFGYKDTFEQLGTAREQWQSSNVLGLMEKMRTAYHIPYTNSKPNVEMYSYQFNGNIMKDLLNV